MFNSEAIVASVTHLDLSNRVFSQDELVQLQVKFPNVHSLKLSEYNLERGVLSVVSVFSHLKSLDLSRCFRLFDEDLASPQWKLGAGLESLTLSACPRIGNNAIAILKGFTSLKSLQISFCPQVTDEGLHHLRRLTNLTSLDLNSMDNMTDAGLEHLRGLRNLRSLNLSFCSQVTDAGLGCIGQLTSLENLDLTNTPVTDAGFEHLRGLRNLRSLNLSFCSQVTDAAIAQLCLELPSLNVRRE